MTESKIVFDSGLGTTCDWCSKFISPGETLIVKSRGLIKKRTGFKVWHLACHKEAKADRRKHK
jgi:hypothetical protein